MTATRKARVLSVTLFLVFGTMAQSTLVSANCIEDLLARSKAGKVQLVWTGVPNASGYEVFRSNEFVPTDFARIATIDSSTNLFLDFPPANGVTYLYRVSALVASGVCESGVVANRPSLRRSRGENNGPVIYTEPIETGSQGRQYRYAAGAADPEGDTLHFFLASAPTGMTIDPQTGLIIWLPASPGVVPAELVVRDPAGNEATQTFIIDVADTNLGGTVELIGPAGGSVIDASGVSVFLPPGALSEDTLIGVQGLFEIDQLPGQVPSPVLPFLGAASLGPEGLRFGEAVTVVVPIAQQLNEGARIPVLVYGGEHNTWVELGEPATVLPGGLTAQFQTSHFSVFTVFRGDDFLAGLFGKIDAVTLLDDFLARVQDRFTKLFNLGGETVLNPGRSPIPGQENLDFFNCYQSIGSLFVVESNQGVAAKASGCSTPEACKILKEQSELVFTFYREFDETFETPAGPARFVGYVSAEIYFQSTSPTLELEVSEKQLWVDQQSPVELRLLCGEQGFRNQQVDVFIKEGFALAAIDPVIGTTSAEGTFDTTLSANPTEGGPVVVSGSYVWTNSLGNIQFRIEPKPDADIDILSLTGDWFASGHGRDFDCEDPEDNGSGSGSGSGSITQTGFRIAGGGDGVRIGATLTPGEDDKFSLRGTWSTGDSSGTWQGGGNVSSGKINVSGSGSGDGCKTAGSGTMERR